MRSLLQFFINYLMESKMFKIVWRDLCLSNPKDNSPILRGLDGVVESGTFMSIMGPSGAGKSSLLALLTARMRKHNTSLKITGQILLNGQPFGLSSFSKISAYVQQDDVLFGTLTVKETFEFQAKLKLWDLTDEEREQRCASVIKKLNLIECANTLVGNSQFQKCISGGQKKRVAIGVQLLSNPHVLIFDEPTSGLDSHNALVIIRLLAELAKTQKKLIITTIHQPSTLIFQQMDQLYLLKKGECIYNGPANQIVSFMQNLKIKVDYRMNPADFFMLEISALKQQQGYTTPFNSSNFKKQYILPMEHYQNKEIKDEENTQQAISTPFFQQFQPLFVRSFKGFIRTPSNQLNKLVTAFMIPLFFGILYNGLANEAPPTPFMIPDQVLQSFMLKFMAFIFMGQYFVFAMNVYDTTLVFPNEKEIIFKETGSNLYSIIVYFLTRLFTEILGCVIPAIICGAILYFSAALDSDFDHFVVFMIILVLMALQGYLFGLMFGVLCKDSETGITLLPMVIIPILIFGGLVIRISDIPEYMRWIQYFSSLRHSFLIIFQDQMKSVKFEKYSMLDLPKLYGLDEDPWDAFYMSLGLIAFYFFASLLLLHILRKRI